MVRKAKLPFYSLRLYVRGSNPQAAASLRRLRDFCDTYLADSYEIDLIDIEQDRSRADLDDIIAVPTLVRVSPGTVRRIVGDFSKTERLLQALEIPVENNEEDTRQTAVRAVGGRGG